MTRALLVSLVSLGSLVAACDSRDDSRPAKAQTPALPALERSTQQDLATELDDAEMSGTWTEVKRRWQGQTLTWKVTRHASLCRTAGDCYVAAFPIQRPAKRGWLPQLVFAPGQFAKLEQTCGDAPHCELTVEGRLGKLEVSAELPTNLRLDEVRVITSTASR